MPTMTVDEAEIVYCVVIYRQHRAQPLLNENGLPYELKRPALAKYRRQ